MRSVVVVVAVGLAGCGSVAGTADAPGGGGDGGVTDAPVDAAPLGPFGPPVRIAELSTTSDDDDPTLTADLLEIVFDSSRPGAPGGGDFWVSRRGSVSSAWGPPLLITELASPFDDTTPEISADGLTLYFGSDRLGNGREIFVTTRATRTDPWIVPPMLVSELGGPGADSAPTATSDGRTMFFETDRAGNYDIYWSTRPSGAPMVPWSIPVPLAGFDSPAIGDGQQWVTDDVLTIYATSNRPPSMASSIWTATRTAPSADFGNFAHLSELDSQFADEDPWLSPDQRTIVFARQRGMGVDYDLFIATR